MDEISFTSGRERCAAWHFDASGDAFATVRGVPCVVMAPGFAGTRDTSALIDYARGVAAAGLTARSRVRAGVTRCARAPRSMWRSTGRSGSPREFAAPLLVQAGIHDSITPSAGARRAAANAGVWGELREYPIDHVDVYTEPAHQRILADQLDFVVRHLSPTASHRAAKTTTDWSHR